MPQLPHSLNHIPKNCYLERNTKDIITNNIFNTCTLATYNRTLHTDDMDLSFILCGENNLAVDNFDKKLVHRKSDKLLITHNFSQDHYFQQFLCIKKNPPEKKKNQHG